MTRFAAFIFVSGLAVWLWAAPARVCAGVLEGRGAGVTGLAVDVNDPDVTPPEFPDDTGWTRRVVVTGTWILVGAILVGPVIKYFQERPRSS